MKEVFRAEFYAQIHINGNDHSLWTTYGLYKTWKAAYDCLNIAREFGYETRVISDWVPSHKKIDYNDDEEKEKFTL